MTEVDRLARVIAGTFCNPDEVCAVERDGTERRHWEDEVDGVIEMLLHLMDTPDHILMEGLRRANWMRRTDAPYHIFREFFRYSIEEIVGEYESHKYDERCSRTFSAQEPRHQPSPTANETRD